MKKLNLSIITVVWTLSIDTIVSLFTLYLMRLCVVTGYQGALYALTALITFCQVSTGVVITAVMNTEKAINTKDGIKFETKMSSLNSNADL